MKNKLLKTIFSNLKSTNKKVDFSLLKGIDVFFLASKTKFWLPLTDTLLTSTPKYGSSNMVKMRKFVEDVRGSVLADAEEGYSDDNTMRIMMQDLDTVKQGW